MSHGEKCKTVGTALGMVGFRLRRRKWIYEKKIIHGSNKLDMEIANALKIISAYRILKYELSDNYALNENNFGGLSSRVPQKRTAIENEKQVIREFCLTNELCFESIEVFAKVTISNTVFSSKTYYRQKTR